MKESVPVESASAFIDERIEELGLARGDARENTLAVEKLRAIDFMHFHIAI
jgi:hypothetical protein